MGEQQESLERVGKYELVRKIATGGMAELFLAKYSGPGGFEKRCALKRILPQFVEDEEFKRMFMNEARVAAMFEHPNLVQIFELGQAESGQFYIAMELINGMDLRQLQNLAREQGADIPPELAAWMMSQALDGLAYAHEFKDIEGNPLNLIHRDISPQNLLVSYEGALKVVDFGIVKAASNEGHTVTGMLKGKISYMSPEQAMADELDARSDLFAIGVCLYELICGVKPFRGKNEIMTLKAILEKDPPPITNYVPDCPHGIEQAIMKALSKNRDDRFENAREFQRKLAEVLRYAPIPIDRHVFSEFLRTLTESGTARFDATKLKIGRPDPQDQSNPQQVRFAISQSAAPMGQNSAPTHPTFGQQGFANSGIVQAPDQSQPGLQQSGIMQPPGAPQPGLQQSGIMQPPGAPQPGLQQSGIMQPPGTHPGNLSAPGIQMPPGAGTNPGALQQGQLDPNDPAVQLAAQQLLAQQSNPQIASSPLADPSTASISGVTHPGVIPNADGGTGVQAKPSLLENKGLLIGLAAVVLFALAGGIAWFATKPGDGTVVAGTPSAATANAPETPTGAPPSPATGQGGVKTIDKAPAPSDAKQPDPVKRPTTKRPTTKRPTTKRPTTKRPETKRPETKQPAVKQPAVAPPPAQPDPPPKPAVAQGKLTLNSIPRGLVVRMDGKKIGRTPMSGQDLDVGTHKLVLSSSKLGIRRTLTVNISKGQTTTQKVTFGRGTLVVNSRPWSEVFVDGQRIGKTPIKRPIYEGRHTIRLVTETGSEQERKITITPGKEQKVLVKF